MCGVRDSRLLVHQKVAATLSLERRSPALRVSQKRPREKVPSLIARRRENPMRTTVWSLLASCTTLLAGCGEVPVEQASPGPQVSTAQAALTTTVTRTFTAGQAIDVGWADELSQGYLLAATDNTNRVATAFLTGTQLQFDPTSQVCVTDPLLGSYCHYTRVSYDSLYANFNPQDVTISGNTAQLKTDLAAATNLTFTRCTYDDTTAVTTCVNIPSGTISLQWRKTNADYTKSVGVTATKTGPQTVRVSGARAFYSADTSGNFVGTQLQHKTGSMGTSTTLTIDVMRTP
jgi:hypothetical protein